MTVEPVLERAELEAAYRALTAAEAGGLSVLLHPDGAVTIHGPPAPDLRRALREHREAVCALLEGRAERLARQVRAAERKRWHQSRARAQRAVAPVRPTPSAGKGK